MPRIPINSIDDPRLAPYRDLANTGGRRDERFVVEGETLVERLISSNVVVESLLVNSIGDAKFSDRVAPDVPVFVADKELVCNLIGYRFHRGALACGIRPAPPSLQDLIPNDQSAVGLIACEAVLDPENVGAILRTAKALGAAGVLLDQRCPGPFARRVMRVSMGAALDFPVIQSGNFANDLQELRQRNTKIIGSVLDLEATPLKSVSTEARFALVLGSEASGLSETTRQACDLLTTLPMHGGCDSLNVAVAAGVIFHQLSIV